MSDHTGIEWCDATWNPIRGCSRVSAGCTNCYAEAVAARFCGPGQPYEGLAKKVNGHPRWTNQVRFIPEKLLEPLRWTRPRRVFVNSMSDLFHEDLPEETIAQIFAVMSAAHAHQFQVLTKRPARMCDLLRRDGFYDRVAVHSMELGYVGVPWPLPNVWLGTSVEDQAAADARIPHLLATPAAVRFLSCEPLLGPMDITPYLLRRSAPGGWPHIHWAIVGGESGPGARPMHPEWARQIRDQCHLQAVPFFFKQYGEYIPWDQLDAADPRMDGDRFISLLPDGRPEDDVEPLGGPEPWPGRALMVRVGKKAAGRLLDGREWNDMPAGQHA